MARWARTPIEVGHPGFRLRPIVLGRADVPVVTDREVARADPELAVLSVIAHGASDRHGLAVTFAALAAVEPFDEERRDYYTSVILEALGPGVRAKLEEEMKAGLRREPTDLEKRILARGEAAGREQGREEGREEGEAVGRAHAVLRVLAARNVDVADEIRDRILACRDPAVLDTWLTRAVTATSAAEVVDS